MLGVPYIWRLVTAIRPVPSNAYSRQTEDLCILYDARLPFFASVVLWIVVGAVWLLPQKLKLMKRLGHLTAHQIIQLGKEGDVEVQSLRKKGRWWIAVGAITLLPQLVVLNIIKTAGN